MCDEGPPGPNGAAEGEVPRSAPLHPVRAHTRGCVFLPPWVSACVWRLLFPPCRLREISQLSCEAFGALFPLGVEGPCRSPAAASSPPDPSRSIPSPPDLLARWERLEAQARAAEREDAGALGAPLVPTAEALEAQTAAAELLMAMGCLFGVTCVFGDGERHEEGLHGREELLVLAICDCSLWGLHAEALRCLDTSSGASSVCAPPLLPPLGLQLVGPSRLLLSLTGGLRGSLAAAEGRLLRLRHSYLLQPQDTSAAAAKANAPKDACNCSPAVAAALEELRASRLPLLLHPKATEVWALRRQQLRVSLLLLLQQQQQQQQQQGKRAAAGDAEASQSPGLAPAAETLNREWLWLIKEASESVSWQVTLKPQEGGLLLLLLQSELCLASSHLQARGHSYQAAEHAHRVLQLFLTEVSAAAATNSSSSSRMHEAADGDEQQQQQQQQQQQGSVRLSRLVSAMETAERQFWRFVCQIVPSHFAGGQQLLRLLSLNLQQMLQQELSAAAPLHASWLAAQLGPGGAAAARAAETAEEAKRILALFPQCEAAWRLCTYSIITLFDWAAQAAAAVAAGDAAAGGAAAGDAAGGDAAAKDAGAGDSAVGDAAAGEGTLEELLRVVALPPLRALVRAEKLWAAQLPACRLVDRHVETLEEELELLLVPRTSFKLQREF